MTSPIKIIIKLIEDNIGDIIAIQDLLRDNGLYELECFVEPGPFLASINSDIDLVITDLRVDNYNALETIRDIHNTYPGIRIVVISAAFTPLIYEQLIWYRVDGVVKKDGAYWTDRLMEWLDHLAPNIIERKKLIAS